MTTSSGWVCATTRWALTSKGPLWGTRTSRRRRPVGTGERTGQSAWWAMALAASPTPRSDAGCRPGGGRGEWRSPPPIQPARPPNDPAGKPAGHHRIGILKPHTLDGLLSEYSQVIQGGRVFGHRDGSWPASDPVHVDLRVAAGLSSIRAKVPLRPRRSPLPRCSPFGLDRRRISLRGEPMRWEPNREVTGHFGVQPNRSTTKTGGASPGQAPGPSSTGFPAAGGHSHPGRRSLGHRRQAGWIGDR